MRARHSLDDPNMRVSVAGRASGTHLWVRHPSWGVHLPMSVLPLSWYLEHQVAWHCCVLQVTPVLGKGNRDDDLLQT